MDRYILITGGELFNKGAQSMTFITVDELKKRFPEKKIILLSSMDYKRSQEEKCIYTFEIMYLPIGEIFKLLGGAYKLFWNAKNRIKNKRDAQYDLKIEEVLKNTDSIIDISGYALSSQWGFGCSLGYLLRIKLAKNYGIKFFIMPQSFGPFSYKGIFQLIMDFLIKKYMKYPQVVYARENEGYDLLSKKYKLKNVRRSYDMVLTNNGINLKNIYKTLPPSADFGSIKGVAIIPNMRNFEHGNSNEIMRLYERAIEQLTKMGKTVYLVRHSFEDIEACKMIKGRFMDNDKVVLLVDDMSCVQFDELVTHFDFIIASRFHSIVHAYRNSVPCIALGWATKYGELLQVFEQSKYVFDVRDSIDMVGFEQAVDLMLKDYKKESETINKLLKDLMEFNIFDVINSNSSNAQVS